MRSAPTSAMGGSANGLFLRSNRASSSASSLHTISSSPSSSRLHSNSSSSSSSSKNPWTSPMAHCHTFVLVLLLSLFFTKAVTDFAKSWVGRLRPDFLDRCQPDGWNASAAALIATRKATGAAALVPARESVGAPLEPGIQTPDTSSSSSSSIPPPPPQLQRRVIIDRVVPMRPFISSTSPSSSEPQTLTNNLIAAQQETPSPREFPTCRGAPKLIRDGRRSFPSGHSSSAFASLGVFAWWGAGVVRWWALISREERRKKKKWVRRGGSRRLQHVGGGVGMRRGGGGSSTSLAGVGNGKKRSAGCCGGCLGVVGKYLRPGYGMVVLAALGPLLGAAYIAISRVQQNVHHPTDIIAGSLIGLFFSTLFYYLYFGLAPSPSTSSHNNHKHNSSSRKYSD
ncbi:hypothetical protein HK102_011298, partial [Quaeritorhiza haematococci]